MCRQLAGALRRCTGAHCAFSFLACEPLKGLPSKQTQGFACHVVVNAMHLNAHRGERHKRVLSYDSLSGLAMTRAFGDFNFTGVSAAASAVAGEHSSCCRVGTNIRVAHSGVACGAPMCR